MQAFQLCPVVAVFLRQSCFRYAQVWLLFHQGKSKSPSVANRGKAWRRGKTFNCHSERSEEPVGSAKQIFQLKDPSLRSG
jgi:hypothetical protein